jgi:glycosyltransferase involved in cell wall biosynthesis
MKKVVYWCLDWFPSVPIAKVGIYNAILNNVIFPKVDRIVAERADACWNLVEAIMTARQTSNPNLFLDNNKVVNPPFAYGNSLEFQGERYSISFFGQIVPKRGLELAIDAISHLKVKGRKIKLEIIGSPPSSEYGKYLREYAKTRGVSDDVFFWGFRPENEIPRIMKHSFAGLAIFQGQPDNSNYTFPAKVIKYLENGVPVIVTKDAFIANEIITNSLGIAINGSLDDLIQAIEKLSSAETMKFFQRKISLYVKKMSRCEQLSKALEELLESRAR